MKNQSILIIIIILIVLSLGTTYAFIQSNGLDNNLQGDVGCFVVDYVGESGQYISPSNELQSSDDYTSGGSSKVTLSKNTDCQIYDEANIYLNTINSDNDTSNDATEEEPDTSETLLTEGALKYTVVDGSNNIIASGPVTTSGATLLTTVTLTNTPTTYTIYIWVDTAVTYVSNTLYDKLRYSGYIYADAVQSSTYTG